MRVDFFLGGGVSAVFDIAVPFVFRQKRIIVSIGVLIQLIQVHDLKHFRVKGIKNLKPVVRHAFHHNLIQIAGVGFAIIEDNCPVQFFRFANALESGLGISRCPYISEFCSISVLVVPPIMLKRGLKPFPLIFSHHLRVNDPLRSGRF